MLALGWRRSDRAAEYAFEGASSCSSRRRCRGRRGYALSHAVPPRSAARVRARSRRPRRLVGGRWRHRGPRRGRHRDRGDRRLRRPRPATAPDNVGRVASVLAVWGAGMPLTVGARFAWSNPRGRRSWGSLIAAASGVAALVGSLIIGLTLTTIVDRPDRWGVNYDQLFGNPYTNAESDIVAPIVDNPNVVAVTGANVGSIAINGADTATIGFESAMGDLVPTVLDGRIPQNATRSGSAPRLRPASTSASATPSRRSDRRVSRTSSSSSARSSLRRVQGTVRR